MGLHWRGNVSDTRTTFLSKCETQVRLYGKGDEGNWRTAPSCTL